MHNEREKGMRDESSLQSGYIIRKNLKDWKQFPSLVHKGEIYALLAPKLILSVQRDDGGCATAKRVFVKHCGTRPNPRKLYQEMPESVNPQHGERCVARNKLNSLLSTMSQFCSKQHFSAILLHVLTQKYQNVYIYPTFRNYFDKGPVYLDLTRCWNLASL